MIPGQSDRMSRPKLQQAMRLLERLVTRNAVVVHARTGILTCGMYVTLSRLP